VTGTPAGELGALFSIERGGEHEATWAERIKVREFLAQQRAAGAFVPRCDSWMSGFSAEMSAELGARGWIGMTWPQKFGGRGTDSAMRYAVVEELLAAGAPVSAHWFADRQIGPGLLRHGTLDQQRKLLPEMAVGRLFFCIGMSEPQSGSDLGSVRTRARRSPGGWLVSGSKIWTSHADRAHYMLALVRTGEPGESPSTALTQVLIDMAAPGITVRPIRTLDGSAHFCEVFLDEVMVPDAMVLGTVGRGWSQVLGELAYERSGPERFLSTFPLVHDFVTRLGGADAGGLDELGRLVSRLGAVRAMSERVNAQLGHGTAAGIAAALVKDIGTRTENDGLDFVRRWIGATVDENSSSPYGELADDFIHAQAHAPNGTLRGGTNEILRNIVAKGVLEG
jgi:alkylation response protein AidB-like acyl-CoA dehydrogenase